MTDIEKELLKSCREDTNNALIYHDWLIDNHRTIDATAVLHTLKASKPVKIKDLVGRILCAVEQVGENIELTLIDKIKCFLTPSSDCGTGCEVTVWLQDINGNLEDLVGSVLLQAEESNNTATLEENLSECTWTFYRFATHKGSVVFRWCGQSNGYYSESAEFHVNVV